MFFLLWNLINLPKDIYIKVLIMLGSTLEMELKIHIVIWRVRDLYDVERKV